MKNTFKKILSAVAFTFLGLGLSISGLAMANNLEFDVAQELNELTLALEQIFIPQEQNEGGDEVLAPELDEQTSHFDTPMRECYQYPLYDEYEWSEEHQFMPWDTSFFARSGGNTPNEREITSDINGDGLMDYLYVRTGGGNFGRYVSCLFFNTGDGFEKVHACYSYYNSNEDVWKYAGDCAA